MRFRVDMFSTLAGGMRMQAFGMEIRTVWMCAQAGNARTSQGKAITTAAYMHTRAGRARTRFRFMHTLAEKAIAHAACVRKRVAKAHIRFG